MMSKNKFIKYVKNEKIEDKITYTDCVKALRKKTIGADGVSIALTILWLEKDIKELNRRNRISCKKLIKWLKSEMREYADYGSYDPFVNKVTCQYFECLRDRRRKELDKNKESSK